MNANNKNYLILLIKGEKQAAVSWFQFKQSVNFFNYRYIAGGFTLFYNLEINKTYVVRVYTWKFK
jgi:hypothetical protein